MLGLIPARGGSKGIPRKNIALLAGQPLLAYTAAAAQAATRLARVILSTEDAEIAAVGRACGLDVPFLRPADLAQDTTPTLPVVQHALRQLAAAGDHYDAVCLLQPTQPLRTAATIDGCVDLLLTSGADSVVTVLPVPAEYHPHWVYFVATDGALHLSNGATTPPPRRQELPPAFHREGSVYVTRTSVVLDGDSLYGPRMLGYSVAGLPSVNLDTPADWAQAAAWLAGGVA
ncbi:MAG: acylneuraminate cytidylyltransferase family protein [Chloroflexota bacterium]|nr:acylneuraminate cytidylyltransferase family protein [Chloroflexota bacterium]